jgi:hypothetical protein
MEMEKEELTCNLLTEALAARNDTPTFMVLKKLWERETKRSIARKIQCLRGTLSLRCTMLVRVENEGWILNTYFESPSAVTPNVLLLLLRNLVFQEKPWQLNMIRNFHPQTMELSFEYYRGFWKKTKEQTSTYLNSLSPKFPFFFIHIVHNISDRGYDD